MSLLYSVARDSIRQGFTLSNPLAVRLGSFPEELQEKRATFVTLKKGGHLRGCMGTLEAVRPLVDDVVRNAFAAAFKDPRFLPLQSGEISEVDIHISILSPLERMSVASEEELLETIRPGTDGLLLRQGEKQATFLPAVWETFKTPDAFVRALRDKAGLPWYWSSALEVYRYTVEEVRDV